MTLKAIVKWILPEYKLNELTISTNVNDDYPTYIKLYCKANNLKYIDWFPTKSKDLMIIHETKIKNWFSK